MNDAQEVSKRDKEILYSNEYRPAEVYLGEPMPNWYCLEHLVPSDKKHSLYLNAHVHNLPVVSHAYLFRWLMPANPVIYSDEDKYSEVDRKVGLYRFTVGERFVISEDEVRLIATGEKRVDQEYLDRLNRYMEKSFLFNALKIPLVDVRVDEVVASAFDSIYEIHNGKTAAEARRVQQKRALDEQEQKLKLLEQVKNTLKSYPDYLSILRRLVAEEMTIDQAIELTGSAGIFTKGI